MKSSCESLFTLLATDGTARTGILHTPHGDVRTPAFMPVATQGSVKSLDSLDLKSLGAKIILSNAYHLYLRPGVPLIEKLGGLHTFMNWNGPILTDSGGFQGFSLSHLRKIKPNAIVFKSHIDGSVHEFGPEASVQYQERLGADIIMPLDICASANSNEPTVRQAMDQTHQWATLCHEIHSTKNQSLFGIVQGGLHLKLREESSSFLTSLGFPGYAIGGLSVGESKEAKYEVVKFTTQLLPVKSPRYLMGVGSPEDLVECVALGIDMFDCILPTRIARNGALYVREGRINIGNASLKNSDAPIDEKCDCYTCTTFSVAYVHHLFKARELLAYRLATIHNLRFIIRLMEEMQTAIGKGKFESYRTEFSKKFTPPKEEIQKEQKRKWLEAQNRKMKANPKSSET